MLTGSYSHSIDAKNRIFIPSKHREKLGFSFVITKNVDKCLSVYSMEEWEKLSAKLQALPAVKARDVIRFVYANAIEVSPDEKGRVIISAELKEYAGFIKDITIIGCNDHAEIWDADTWKQKNSDENTKDILDQMIELGL